MNERQRQELERALREEGALLDKGISPVYAAIGAIVSGNAVKTTSFIEKKLEKLGYHLDAGFNEREPKERAGKNPRGSKAI